MGMESGIGREIERGIGRSEREARRSERTGQRKRERGWWSRGNEKHSERERLDSRASAAGLARTFSFTSCSCLGDRLRSCRIAVLPCRQLTHPTGPANKPTASRRITRQPTRRTKSCVTIVGSSVLRPGSCPFLPLPFTNTPSFVSFR